ncbi:MAG: hypothetical protein KatS3mg003_1123 [Candidatus Nitrosocaldaceae archaeon]|nr:MAG: hypothetical protein KatS3mg003_1123 [Candidatus Nitrosocaldaceae archaeon]
MFSRFTIAAIISAIILLSSIVYTTAQQTRNETKTLPVQTNVPLYANIAEYSVKFVCGNVTDPTAPVTEGEYKTAINIHNPGPKEVEFIWKVASHDGRISEFIKEVLKPDQAMEIDCNYIQKILEDERFTKGFVVIHQPLELTFQKLDVTSVYTVNKETIVNKIWFKILADDCITNTQIFEAGIEDNFTNGTEQASPSPALAVFLANYPSGTRNFDDLTNNRVFGHTFSNLPDNIVAATLEMAFRAGTAETFNDSFALDFSNNTQFAYASSLANIHGGSWNDNDSTSIILDLANLPISGSYPTDILASINEDHALDIYIQDDTGIDFARLTVTSCIIPDEVEELIDKDLAVVVESDLNKVISIEDEIRSVLAKQLDETSMSIISIKIKDVEVGVGTGQSMDVEQIEPKFIRLP